MSKPIKTYNDLLVERQKLETLLKAQGQLLRYDISEVKQEFGHAFKNVGWIFTRNTSNMLLAGGANKLIDVIIRRGILSKAGWFTRLVVPFLIKNYSSHYIADHKSKWMSKLFSWIGRRNQNGKMAPEHKEDKDTAGRK